MKDYNLHKEKLNGRADYLMNNMASDTAMKAIAGRAPSTGPTDLTAGSFVSVKSIR